MKPNSIFKIHRKLFGKYFIAGPASIREARQTAVDAGHAVGDDGRFYIPTARRGLFGLRADALTSAGFRWYRGKLVPRDFKPAKAS